MKKRILIIHATYGSGHKTVATYINDYLKENTDYEIEMIDFMDYANIIGNISKTLFNENFKHKSTLVFNSIFSFFNHTFTTKIYKYATTHIIKEKEFKKYITEFNPDVVVSTHFFGTIISSLYKKQNLINSRIISIITDYQIHELWLKEVDNIDALIVGNKEMKKELLDRNISKNIIYPYGIPISNKFNEAKDLKEKSNLDILFFSGGSIGSSFSYKYLKKLIKSKLNYNITFVCGHNKKLKKKVDKLVSKYNHDKIKALGFTNKVNELLDECNLVITKPGGISVTECVKKQRPMLLIQGNGGPENDNLKYLCNKGFALDCKTPKKLNETLKEILTNRKILNMMYNNLKKEKQCNSLERIHLLIEKQ